MMPAGRPTTYDPKYCEMAIECLSQGHSIVGFAGTIPVSKTTIYNWMEDHPEFLAAVKEGQAAAVTFWERLTVNLARTGEGNATACIFGLKNRASDEWRDKTEQDINANVTGQLSWARFEKPDDPTGV